MSSILDLFNQAFLWAATLALALLGPFSSALADKNPSFVIGGEDSNIPVIQAMIDAYRSKDPQTKIKIVKGLGGTGSIRGVEEGRLDLGLIASAPGKNSSASGLVFVPYARSPIVFVGHRGVTDSDVNLTSAEIVEIYSGKKSKWEDGTVINVVSRERGDSGAELLMSQIPGLKPVFEAAWDKDIWRVEYSEVSNVKTIGKIKNSLGWADLSYIAVQKPNLQVFKLDGVEANAANITSGRYPLVRELVFVHRDPLSQELQNFVKFVKSPDGTAILRRYSEIPVN